MDTINKPELSFWQIWNMSFGFLGIQFGWGLQMANMSSIYRYLGASGDQIPLLWLAAPMTGLLVQPIIGYMSDHTWNRFGRRKPYFLVGAILSSLALLAMPNCSALWMAAGLLWILDASINISMEPFRAFVSDMLPKKQQAAGFTMQSFFIGLGAVIASSMPWIFTHVIGLTDTNDQAIPETVRYSFYIGALVFIGAILYTIFTTKEYPPLDKTIPASDKKSALQKTIDGFVDIINNIKTMPTVMSKIALVQFFSWMGLFLMWFYFGDAVATHVFGAQSPQDSLYKEGSAWGGLMFGFYSLITFLFAFILNQLAKKVSNSKAHMICLFAGGIGLMSVLFIQNKYGLLITMTGVGIAWTSILSMPYAIFAPHLPRNKVGVYMGIFNFFIVIPEIIAALGFGWFMKHVLDSNSLYAVVLGGAFMCVAALLCLRIKAE